jgi:hypothetical protein
MPWRFHQYDDPNGDEKWAVWSTIVDNWICYDMTEAELVEWYAKREYYQARHQAARRCHDLRNGENVYYGGLPTEEMIEELEQMPPEDERAT